MDMDIEDDDADRCEFEFEFEWARSKLANEPAGHGSVVNHACVLVTVAENSGRMCSCASDAQSTRSRMMRRRLRAAWGAPARGRVMILIATGWL
jgi:hypothetical protein